MTSIGMLCRRACAALAAGSAGLHAAMLGHVSSVIAGVLLAVMIGACLFCARELWRDGTMRAWVVVALMNLAMIALHLPAPAHHHHHAAAPGQQPAVMAAATSLALVEVLAAAVVLYVRSRGRMVAISGTPDR